MTKDPFGAEGATIAPCSIARPLNAFFARAKEEGSGGLLARQNAPKVEPSVTTVIVAASGTTSVTIARSK
jgi:hypothetical protein